jgi:PAS domain S-box-containing protein
MNKPDHFPGLALMFNLSPDPLCLLSPENGFLMVNEAFTQLSGYSEHEFHQKTFPDFIHPHDRENTHAGITSLMEHTAAGVFESRYLCADNQYKWFSWNAKRLPDKNCYVSARDITKYKKLLNNAAADTDETSTLHSLKLSIERFEYVTEATSDIIWDWNLETNEVTYSANIEKSFGHRPGGKIGDTRFFAHYVHPEDRERVVLYPEPVKYGSMKYWAEEYRFRKANGEYAFVLDKGIVIRDEKGVGIRMIGAMQDISELKNKELHISKQKDQLMEIARINAHEIRRPVASILGLSSLIDKRSIVDKENLETLHHLEVATLELDTVIKRIIDKTVG